MMVDDRAMLDLIRNYRNLFSAIFVVSALGMVISMFGGPGGSSQGRRGASLGSGIAAKVEGDEIPSRDLILAMKQQMDRMDRIIEDEVQKSQNKVETRKFLEGMVRNQVTPDRVLGQLIQEKFMLSTAEHAGVASSVEAVKDMIQSNPVFKKEGRFDPLAYKQMVSEPGRYEKALADQTRINNLNRAFIAGLSAMSPEEIKLEQKLHHKAEYESLGITPTTFPEPKNVSADEVAKFLADEATSKAKLQAYYDRNVSKFKSDEKIQARHILIRDSEGGEAKAKEVLTEIQSKKITFADAAKKYSSDKSNSDKGGDLGFFGRGVMDPAFEKAAFDLKNKGDLTSAPVKSSFGFHLIELVERKAGENRTLDQVKKEIAPVVLLEERKSEKARAWIQQWTSSGKSPSDPDLKKLDLKWQSAEWSPLDDSLGSVGSVDDVRAALTALNAGKPVLSQVLTKGSTLYLIRYKGEKAPPKTETKTAKNVPAAPPKTDDSPSQLQQSKAQAGYSYFLKVRYENLEKAKKIVKSEGTIAEIRSRYATQQNDGG